MDEYGADILRLWVMTTDTTEDLRIGPEILKQQAELYRRLRNTLRWLLGSLDGFQRGRARPARATCRSWSAGCCTGWPSSTPRCAARWRRHDWTGVYPAIHDFCAADLSAFYFDIRKDALYCDRPDSLRRRAARTVLDHLHRCLDHLARARTRASPPRRPGAPASAKTASVHLQDFPACPARWQDEALAREMGAAPRDPPRVATGALERARGATARSAPRCRPR